jgi:hypothetical protein
MLGLHGEEGGECPGGGGERATPVLGCGGLCLFQAWISVDYSVLDIIGWREERMNLSESSASARSTSSPCPRSAASAAFLAFCRAFLSFLDWTGSTVGVAVMGVEGGIGVGAEGAGTEGVGADGAPAEGVAALEGFFFFF